MEQKAIRVIVVDDEPRALNRMKLIFNNFPEVEVLDFIGNADDAFEAVLKHEPHLVFMDIEMPGKSGLELADDINKNNLETKIVYITAHDHYAIKAIKNGVFDYLLKPVNIDELKKTISVSSNKSSIELFINDVQACTKKDILSKDYTDLKNDEIPRYYMQVRYGTTFSKSKHIRVYSYFADCIIFKDGALWRDG